MACLYVVATPIGNLEDMSPRAVRVLSEVALILAEDTRHSRPLLNHFGINTPMQALHEHNESQMAPVLCERIRAGESMALISDAGTPLVSDPGYVLVRTAHEMSLQVSPIPGPTASMAALSAAGLPSNRFVFEGFLPAKASKRRQALEALLDETRTLIFYEAPHRIVACLQDMTEIFGGDRLACIARELTKRFETVRQGDLAALSALVETDENQQKGEFVVMVAGAEPRKSDEESVSLDKLIDVLLTELSPKQTASLAAKITGMRRNDVYSRVQSRNVSK